VGTIAWFGRHLDAPAYEDAPEVEVPLGATCLGCGELVDEYDAGITMPYVDAGFEVQRCAYHVECHLRSVLGGVAHLERRCSCYGGKDHDGHSREEARALLDRMLAQGARWAN
jgi:hypothetical protein